MLNKVYGQDITLICTVGDQKVNLGDNQDNETSDLVDFAINNLNGQLLEEDLFEDGKVD